MNSAQRRRVGSLNVSTAHVENSNRGIEVTYATKTRLFQGDIENRKETCPVSASISVRAPIGIGTV